MFRLRITTERDRHAVGTLLDASYSQLLREHYAQELLSAALPLMTKANPRLLSSGRYFVAVTENGEVIGCGGWSMEQPGTGIDCERAAHIRHFATHPNWLRNGVASSILQRCLAEAGQCGVRVVDCYSTLGGERFYASAGFKTISKIGVPLAGDVTFPAIHMRRVFECDVHHTSKGQEPVQ